MISCSYSGFVCLFISRREPEDISDADIGKHVSLAGVVCWVTEIRTITCQDGSHQECYGLSVRYKFGLLVRHCLAILISEFSSAILLGDLFL